MKEVTIQGKQVTITKFGAVEGWKLLHKLLTKLGPSMAVADDDLGEAVKILSEKLDENQFVALLTQLTSVCLIDGKKVDFARDCADYSFTLDLVVEVLEYNFSDFFLSVAQKVRGLQGS